MWLRHFSKLTCIATLLLIFIGGMVTSTSSGLAVPDWPLSYGTLFPPMIGGVFYEHGHRMAASLVGLLMLSLAIWLGIKEERAWLKNMGYIALGAVIAQGILGGITVLFFLPTPISVSHGVLAQTFFLMTIFIAYTLSNESKSEIRLKRTKNPLFIKATITFICIIYVQLILGAIMRHTGSGLAIPDFPKMGGSWWPSFDQNMLFTINDWRFDLNLDPVLLVQVVYHFLHRMGALIILIVLCVLNGIGLRAYKEDPMVKHTIWLLDGLITLQITLGITTVLSLKSPIVTSLHVVTGAATLGLSFLLLLRISPLRWREFRSTLLT